MSYITREDGERFVAPSYRDVLTAKKGTLLKKEIILLSENYGDYATIIKKKSGQYEVAFSPDHGYLLGETVWQYFKRPSDLIYCEVLPGTSEAILVIVKSGSVFLDGSFPVDSIPDELVVFLTQKNNFEIHVFGDVPLGETPEEGKFAFDPSQVKSFNTLSEPAFPRLPKVKSFQLNFVDIALKAQGIGVFPLKSVIALFITVGLAWMGFNYLTSTTEELPATVITEANPLEDYISRLASPSPSTEIEKIVNSSTLLISMPGWTPKALEYGAGGINVSVKSLGAETAILLEWIKQNNLKLEVQPTGFYLTTSISLEKRAAPTTISPLIEVIASLVDRLNLILPGNSLTVESLQDKGSYKDVVLVINFNNISLNTLSLIGRQLKDLPLVLTKVSIEFVDGYLSGTINLSALGN